MATTGYVINLNAYRLLQLLKPLLFSCESHLKIFKSLSPIGQDVDTYVIVNIPVQDPPQSY